MFDLSSYVNINTLVSNPKLQKDKHLNVKTCYLRSLKLDDLEDKLRAIPADADNWSDKVDDLKSKIELFQDSNKLKEISKDVYSFSKKEFTEAKLKLACGVDLDKKLNTITLKDYISTGKGRVIEKASDKIAIIYAQGEIIYGKIPPYSVVVPGSLPNKNDPLAPSLYCAVIIKQVDEKTRSKTSVNDLLRD